MRPLVRTADDEVHSATQRVIAEYMSTTSGTGSAVSASEYSKSVEGLRRRLKPWLDVKDCAVVDLGSGTGEVCKLAMMAGASVVTGVNLCVEEIEFSQAQCGAAFVNADVLEYLENAEGGSCDRIFALNILEHLDKNKLILVLEQAFRVLRPGGDIVAMVPNATSPFGGMTRYWDITHELAFTPSSVRQLGKLVGFDRYIDFRECGPIPYGVKSTIRYVLWRCIRVMIKAYLMIETASAKGAVYSADMFFKLKKPDHARIHV